MPSATSDPDGHGTHVAGIIAGESWVGADKPLKGVRTNKITREFLLPDGRVDSITDEGPDRISGVAPLAKLMSLRVINQSNRKGSQASSLIAAIGYIQRLNNYGERIRVHGLNLSVGYEYNAEWFAAGRSPLCNEVDRLVKSGVVVVVAAGNAGYGRVMSSDTQYEVAAHASTIADPGNAELAITVGATHRNMPHAYGVSFFSAKGPTADGRAKPDLLAPGERIISAAANNRSSGSAVYREANGTSMAAPHVSGAIAALLSIRKEFIGRPSEVKDIILRSATDLGRVPHFQGK